MITAVLLAMSMLNYAGGDNRPSYMRTYPEYVNTMPANAGFELPEPTGPATVTVVGKVVRPGDYRLDPGMTLSDLIGQAGSFVHEADYEDINIVRQTPDGELTYSLSWRQQWQTQVLLHPGDVVIVPDRGLSTY